MRTYFIRILFCVVACLALNAHGQILDSIQQCDDLYGAAVPPTDQTSDIRFYQHDGITIKILFVEGKAEVITFSAAAGTGLDDHQQLILLEKNAASSKWEEVEGAGPRTWARADGEVFGFYDTSKSELTIMTASYLSKTNGEAQPPTTEKVSAS